MMQTPMMQSWSGWKRFADGELDDSIDAPAGPGVYEVRHTVSGRVLAFGHSNHVAKTIGDLRFGDEAGWFAGIFARRLPVSRVCDLEYRTCATQTHADAKTAAQRLLGLRRSAWRRRIEVGLAMRH